jgi:hypothetical protein
MGLPFPTRLRRGDWTHLAQKLGDLARGTTGGALDVVIGMLHHPLRTLDLRGH